MSILTAIYNLLIGPLELLFEIIFSLANRIVDNPGLSIVCLSLAMNFLVLPLYKEADAMQAKARDTEAKLNHWVTHIKKTFKGDERFMILQTYYRQNGYKPTDSLKGSMSLLLEVPFFMAAYNFLSHLELLNGISFGPLRDLGAPDGLLTVAGYSIHVLPILMTAINLVSSAIYAKDLPLKSKIQLYGMAAIFLVLLYESPSGLVFYWILNNIFSLFKNIFYKLKNPKFVFGICSSIAGAALLVFVLAINPMNAPRKQAVVVALGILMQLPLAASFAQKFFKAKKEIKLTKTDTFLFRAGCVFMTVLVGFLVPSSVIKASPAEFVHEITFTNPVTYILNSLCLAAGTFIVWFGIFYMLAAPFAKKVMSFVMCAVSGMAIVNYMFFGTEYGNLSPQLKFEDALNIPLKSQLVNLAVVMAVAAVLFLLWKLKAEVIKVAYFAAGLAAVGMSVVNLGEIQKVVPATIEKLQEAANQKPTIPLSKTGQNVIVMMLDRGVSAYIPYLFKEKPELQKQFAGFTYYPNTISFGGHTNFGSPPLYGGYEYTPEEMNKRSDELLRDKHNEALKVMPVSFSTEGYDVTVCDPSYANYDWIPDLSIYSDYPDIQAYNTIGQYKNNTREEVLEQEKIFNRDLFLYSIFKVSPTIVQPDIYSEGMYNRPDDMFENKHSTEGATQKVEPSERFMQSYAVLQNLPSITRLTEESENTFLMMANDTTHEPTLLKQPEYEPAEEIPVIDYQTVDKDRFVIDGQLLKMETEPQVQHYHSNMAAMIQLGKWFDYMRENGVYDNTRIIIVADHGFYLGQIESMTHEWDSMAYNPLFMVKDFNSKEFTVDKTFMTNADVPTIAMEGLIDNPTNPFTGKPINNNRKTESEQHITMSTEFNVTLNNGTKFTPSKWLSVKDNIFDPDNWSYWENPIE